MSDIVHHALCRVCQRKTRKLYSLGNLYVSDFIKHPKSKKVKAPLELSLCTNHLCGLMQLSDTVPYDEMYRNYWYKSGINQKIVDDLKGIVAHAVDMVEIKDGDIFLDIGANDGTLLKYAPRNMQRIGVEPAENLQKELSENCDVAIKDYWENVRGNGNEQAKIITAIGMFYDSEDPNMFIDNVRRHLAQDGIFIAQLMTAAPMLFFNDIGNICHEHLEYYTYNSLVYLYESNGLEIFKVEKNDINGGSYRLYARHYTQKSVTVDEKLDYISFIQTIKSNREDTMRYLWKQKNKSKRIYVYGASTKGNTILQWYRADRRLIDGAADKNEEKWGKYMAGGDIPIVSEEEARARADIFWIMPWGFTEQFLKREEQWRNTGGQFVVSIPHFQVYD